MNRVSQQQLLNAVFREVLDREFQADSLDDRVILQKIVFFMREMGVSCGSYKFVWDLYGPFSPALSDDMKKHLKKEEAPVVFNPYAKEVMEKLSKVFHGYKSYQLRYWVEAIASLHYLREYMYPSYSDEKIIAELERQKRETLCDHQENLRAMNALEEIFAV